MGLSHVHFVIQRSNKVVAVSLQGALLEIEEGGDKITMESKTTMVTRPAPFRYTGVLSILQSHVNRNNEQPCPARKGCGLRKTNLDTYHDLANRTPHVNTLILVPWLRTQELL